MINFTIPGRGDYRLEHLVMDVNGTLAVDGQLIEGVREKVALLRNRVTVHLLTSDTHGRQAVIDRQLDLTAVRISPGNEALQKADYVRNLGGELVVAIGQGANDAEMLSTARLGICVSQRNTLMEAREKSGLTIWGIVSGECAFHLAGRISHSYQSWWTCPNLSRFESGKAAVGW